MNVTTLTRRHPIPIVVTAAFVLALAVTAAYWAGIVPGVPKTLPTFVDMVMVTVALLAVTALAWAMALLA